MESLGKSSVSVQTRTAGTEENSLFGVDLIKGERARMRVPIVSGDFVELAPF